MNDIVFTEDEWRLLVQIEADNQGFIDEPERLLAVRRAVRQVGFWNEFGDPIINGRRRPTRVPTSDLHGAGR